MNNYELITKRSITKILLLSLIVFVSYLTIYKSVDNDICYKNIARKLNIAPSFASLKMYIEKLLPVGLDRYDVHEKLQIISPISIKQIDNGEGILDRIVINMCNHPLNNLTLYTYYTFSGKLTSILFEFEP